MVEPTDERLRAALDRAFAEPDHPPYRWTKAVVIVHDGRIVAERYAPGYDVDTPLLGYSASKSVISALIGILVRQGASAVEQPAPVAAWSQPDDPRHVITIDHLLRMTSGLALDETGSPFAPVARMLYLERDMAGYAESAGLEANARSTWNYTSGNTLILSRIIRDAVGGARRRRAAVCATRAVRTALGMRNVTLELDASRHAGRIDLHAGAGARLGTLRHALPERRRRRRAAHPAGGLGALLDDPDPRHRLRGGLLDQSRRGAHSVVVRGVEHTRARRPTRSTRAACSGSTSSWCLPSGWSSPASACRMGNEPTLTAWDGWSRRRSVRLDGTRIQSKLRSSLS